jgi:hypothetical protein
MPWMALGGTTVNIPEPILTLVSATKVLGVARYVPASQLSANMLSQAKSLCLGLLGSSPVYTYTAFANFTPGLPAGYLNSAANHLLNRLILQNGDAELWLRLCAVANPPPVHVLTLDTKGGLTLEADSPFDEESGDLLVGSNLELVASDLYPAGVPVGNEQGGIDPTLEMPTASSKGNLWPWCLDDTTGYVPSAAQAAWVQANNIPICPCNVKIMGNSCGSGTAPDVSSCGSSAPVGSCFDNNAGDAWAVRGAINAGMSVFLYVQSIEKSGPAPDYNQCTLLK